MSCTEKHGKWEMYSVEHCIWASYNERHGKLGNHIIELGIWVSCTEKMENEKCIVYYMVYDWVNMKNMENEKYTL